GELEIRMGQLGGPEAYGPAERRRRRRVGDHDQDLLRLRRDEVDSHVVIGNDRGGVRGHWRLLFGSCPAAGGALGCGTSRGRKRITRPSPSWHVCLTARRGVGRTAAAAGAA